MKILIILSLVAICLAGRNKIGRKGFLFPGQPKATHTLVWSDYGTLGSLNSEKSSNAEKSSEESAPVLSNPNRRDVKFGNGFPGLGFHGPVKQAQSDDKKDKAVPSFIANPKPVLEKVKSSSGEESQASVDQQEKSSSEEKSQSSSLSSSEETNAPSTNQEAPVNANISAPAENQTELPKVESESSEEADSKVIMNEEPVKKLPFLPFVGANRLARLNRVRDVDTKRPEAPKPSSLLNRRPLRSADFKIQDFGLKLSHDGAGKVQEPQGGLGSKQQKRVRRPIKQ